MGVFLWVSHAPALHNFRVLPLFMFTTFDVQRRVTPMGTGLFLGGQPRPPSQGGVAPADPNFRGSPLYMRTQFDLERSDSAYGEGRVLGGQPRHCILHECVARFISSS